MPIQEYINWHRPGDRGKHFFAHSGTCQTSPGVRHGVLFGARLLLLSVLLLSVHLLGVLLLIVLLLIVQFCLPLFVLRQGLAGWCLLLMFTGTAIARPSTALAAAAAAAVTCAAGCVAGCRNIQLGHRAYAWAGAPVLVIRLLLRLPGRGSGFLGFLLWFLRHLR